MSQRRRRAMTFSSKDRIFLRPHSKSLPKTVNEVKQAARKRSNTVDFGFLCPDFETIKISQVQQQFPYDSLCLDEDLDAQYYLIGRALSSRRRPSPYNVFTKLHDKLTKSSSNLNAETAQSHSAKTPTPSDDLTPGTCRNFIQEGPVHLSTGVSSLTRYMFLFSDLLLIAKPKSNASYKLKIRLPVNELWLRENIDDVTEETVSADKSFVIGWPTVSYVATFHSMEEKTLWWNVLKKTVESQRSLESERTIPIRILNRNEDQNNKTPLSLPVTNKDDVKSTLKMALDGFEIQNVNPCEYQLWVVSGKENAAYPLIGHEIPYCIKMNHVRQSNANSPNASPLPDNELNLKPESPKSRCEFILKKKKDSRPRIEFESPSAQKRWRSPMKSPIINWALHKKPSKQGSPLNSPQGCLFGLSLAQITVNHESLPQPIEDMLVELFRRGPSTVGIFRKSALMKSVKQLRRDLDEGKIVSLQDKSSLVIATVFKEFLRALPICSFGNEFPSELSTIKDISATSDKVNEIERHLNRLPKVSHVLLKKFFCVLYHISKYSNTNNMTAQNLAICIAPSLVWTTKTLNAASPSEAVSACEVVQFIIENYVEIFGEEATRILGDESEIQQPMSYDEEESTDINSENLDLESQEIPLTCDTANTGVKLRLLVPQLNNMNSMSNPGTPEPRRRQNSRGKDVESTAAHVVGLNMYNRRHSANDLTDINDNVDDNHGGKSSRKRFTLESYTTTAELIQHRINGNCGKNNNKLGQPSSALIQIISYDNSVSSPPTEPKQKTSPSSNLVYHQNTRSAPSYEEAIRALRQNNEQQRSSSPQFSSRSSDKGSSNSSLDNVTDNQVTSTPKNVTSSSSKVSQLRDDFTNSCGKALAATSQYTNSERQILVQRNAEPFQTKKYTADELRKQTPDEVFSTSARWKQRGAPSYEEHVQRRKRFERAYLNQINLARTKEAGGCSDRLADAKENSQMDNRLAQSFCHPQINNNNNNSDEDGSKQANLLSKSLDAKTLRSLRNRTNSDGRGGIPLNNGIHTFVTQKKEYSCDRSAGNDSTKQTKISQQINQHHEPVSATRSVPRNIGNRDEPDINSPPTAIKPMSPLRAAINAGSFMYCSSEEKNDQRNKVPSTNKKGLQSQSAVNKFNKTVRLSDKQKLDFKKAAEDFDKILSNLRNYDAASDSSSTGSHSSISDSACDFDMPSHEDIKNILCQDESYV